MSAGVTSSSVVGITFEDGVCVATDTLGSYGSLAKYRKLPRIVQLTDRALLAAGGDYADFQYVRDLLENKIHLDTVDGDTPPAPRSLFCWLRRLLYDRRTRLRPLRMDAVVAGLEPDGEPFLGVVDLRGTAFSAPSVATAMGAYLALPGLREAGTSLRRQQAAKLLEDKMRVLLLRDARSCEEFQLAVVDGTGVTIEPPRKLHANWQVAHSV
ncbi:proteasome subunit beta type-4-like [Schistocerca gregaria]|uniref:proteasome subunit beta type-4-like n=1 Tax=Schistocerca gregaria TaxID=7010 RepID=UPI00211E2DE4|nr:proteasome subunit beta type-4-like [Schistocerca gregaria]